ncbi:hypothetical protein M0805_009415 [Coniferiporia weirii]|nr:hypothetical protein M0805_009415 [Coniferiporia weirii]
MPLPANSSISLQGHSRPGEGITTKPKIAMVVRMTEETLEALQNLSSTDRMDFEFGDRPGIHIREQFFPMRYNKEKDNQELFIRTTMSARPNAPLKLNANVVGKFLVERHLSDVAVQRVRDATAAAAKQKSERKTIMIDTPPTMPTVTQKSVVKRKGPPKSTPKSTPTIVKSYAITVPPTSEPGGSTSSVSFPKETIALYRQRLIHYLALGAATQPDVVKEVGGLEVDRDVRLKITEILNEVAEQEQVARKAVSASQDTKWRLKPQTWKEVRPYQYQGYTDNVRTAVARSARTWLKSLKIPENDPSWDHVKFRSNGITAANTGAGAVQRAVNGTSTATAKAKAKAKDAKMKDLDMKAKLEASVPPTRPPPVPVPTLPRPNQPAESGPATMRTGKGKERETEKEEGEVSPSETPPRPNTVSSVRRLPGSRSAGTTTPTMQPPPVPSAVQSSSSQNSTGSLPKRTGPVDVRGPKRAPPEPSERVRAAPPIPPPVPSDRKPVIQVKREVVSVKREREAPVASANAPGVPGASTLAAREREPMKRERERESDRESVRGVKREKDRESDRESVRGRERDLERERDRERERERDIRERERAARGREREKERDKEKGKERERLSSSTAMKANTKRKATVDSDDDSSDWGYEGRKKAKKSANASSTKVKHEREGSSLKVPTSSSKAARRESSPPRKIKRELSPLPPSKSAPSASQGGHSGLSSSMPKVKKEVKVEREREDSARPSSKQPKKRRSPIYTSSSDSEEEDARPKKVKVTPKAPAARARVTRPLPALSKHDSLRSRYSSTYSEYLLAFQKLVSQKNKLTTMLRHGSASASGESDGDGDMLSIEELEELSARHQRLHDELESIKKSYMA